MGKYTTQQLIALIQNTAISAGIDPGIAVAQLARESKNFAPYYVYGPGASPKGAGGVAQFMPGTAARFGLSSADRFDPDKALPAWAAYMMQLLSMFAGRYDLALAGYNWGEGSRALNNRPQLYAALDSGQSILNYSGVPTETRNYITAILGASASTPTLPDPGNQTDAAPGSYDLSFFTPGSTDNGLQINWLAVAVGAAVIAALLL